MSSDDYDSIDRQNTPRVASISDLTRKRAKTAEIDTSEDDSSSMSSNLLEPLQNLFLHKDHQNQKTAESSDEPQVTLRGKKKNLAPRGDATVSHYEELEGDDKNQKFKRRSAERHSMLAGAADFATRRQSKGYGSGKWTDLFSSSRFKRREARKKLHVNFPSSTPSNTDDYGSYGSGSIGGLSMASNSSGESMSRPPQTAEEIKAQFRNVMIEKAIPSAKVDQLVEATSVDQMMMMVKNAKRNDDAAKRKQSPNDNLNVLQHILKSSNLLDCKKDIVTIRVQLQCQSVTFLYEFADELHDENGRTGFELMCQLYSLVIKHLRNSQCGSKLELDLIDFLQEIVRCIRTIVNTYKGLEIVLRKNSPVCSLLIQTLNCLNRRKPSEQEPAEVRALRIESATICASLMLVSHETTKSCCFEMTGQQKFFAELTNLARNEMKSGAKHVSRFRPFVQCLQFFGDREPSSTMRVLLMLSMLTNAVDRNTSDGQNWTEEMVWQMRMRLRSEAARDGLNKYIERYTGENVDSRVREVAQNMVAEQNADFETLVGKYENLKTEYDSLDSCFEFLATTSEASGVESILLSLFQLLALIPDDMGAKRSYLKLIEVCVSEIVLHRTPLDTEFGERFVFETPVQDIIEQLQDEEMTKKLRQATAAKQEAVAMQGEYWKAIGELQKETQLLRKHVSDPKTTPLPPPTKINVSAPDTSSNSIPPVTGGPPPPPPPGGLPPITGGPPPPPPPGGLPPITGGPPPPPPMGGLPPIKGGPPPPPPPPPPPGAGGGPPPPPPPPGGIGGAKGIPFAPFVPPIPDYLPKKNVKKVDVPMRKFPWGSNTINPRDIPKESFWAHTNEEAILNDGMLERVKNQFSNKTNATSAASKLDVAGKARKVKTAQVIQDDKVLQRLGILQGSLKMTHKELRNAILEVNERVLTPGFLEQLRGCLPTGDVLKKLQEVDKNQFEEMPEGEQFATRLAQINALPLRLDLIEFKMKLSEILGELKPSMSSVMEGCEEIRKSDGLRVFLQLILAFGNYMSGSTKNYTNTYGFEMRMLTRLVDTKDVENKHTLLHHLIREMKRIEPRKARFAINDFHHCVESSRVNAEELAKTTRMIKVNINKLENCLKVYKSQGEKDRFEEKMKPFLERATKEFSTVEMMSEKMKNDWESLAKYFAFDTKKYPMEEFFTDIRTFTEQYLTAWRELDAEAEAEAKRAKAADTQTQRRHQKARQPFGERQISMVPENGAAEGAKPINRTPAAMIRVSTASDKAGVLDELERATGNEAFLQTLMSATNSRTPRIGNQARSRTGRAAMERQRSRNGGSDSVVMNSISMAAPLFSNNSASASSSTASTTSGDKERERKKSSDTVIEVKTSSSALERAKAIGVGLPGQGELKMRVRRNGAPAVPVERAVPTESSRNAQISPTHKENRQPTQQDGKKEENEEVLPSTDDLLARLNKF